MQHIPDKQFDKLFKDKFTDAEVEPSSDLWANIEKQLAPKKKRVIPIYWIAAASVAIVISAILVFSKKEVIRLQGNQEVATVVNSTVAEDQNLVVNPESTLTKVAVNEVKKTIKSLAFAKQKENVTDNQKVNSSVENNVLAMQPIQTTDRLPIKQQDVKPLEIVPIKDIPVEQVIYTAKVDVPQTIEDNTISENTAPRKGIRNVGDLVNYVVDKVDKRDKKLLRFNTDDDDNSSLIGINIGFLKLNKKNK